MTEIKLPKCYKEIDNCEDILRGHCKDYEPHINGFFLSVKQARVILEALELNLEENIKVDLNRRLARLTENAIDLLTGSEKE